MSLLLLIAAVWCSAGTAPVRQAGEQPELAPLPSTVPNLARRLGALNPTDPSAYFTLAEELGAEASDKPSRDLARTLYVLAFELYRAGGRAGDGEMARSATLGLASLTTLDRERRWLAAVGDQVAPLSEKALTASARLPAAIPEATAFNLATAMGLARSGEGRRAETYLGREGVRELLRATQATVGGGVGSAVAVEKWVQDWPVCPTCKNRRIVTKGNESRLCPYCGGNPGPKLSDGEVLSQYRAESLLLKGVYRSWSAQLLADDGDPLRDPAPGDVAPSFGVDPRATVWRSGVWTTP
ncbi:MAG: hypothetical protein K2X84_10455 [Beijerinckiaceae bacterium]|nr:hypothetical protein [Beijerinckiaceae bacterium]